mgnify:CR=1 FL=1
MGLTPGNYGKKPSIRRCYCTWDEVEISCGVAIVVSTNVVRKNVIVAWTKLPEARWNREKSRMM